MKKAILLLISVLVLTLCSCINNYVDEGKEESTIPLKNDSWASKPAYDVTFELDGVKCSYYRGPIYSYFIGDEEILENMKFYTTAYEKLFDYTNVDVTKWKDLGYNLVFKENKEVHEITDVRISFYFEDAGRNIEGLRDYGRGNASDYSKKLNEPEFYIQKYSGLDFNKKESEYPLKRYECFKYETEDKNGNKEIIKKDYIDRTCFVKSIDIFPDLSWINVKRNSQKTMEDQKVIVDFIYYENNEQNDSSKRKKINFEINLSELFKDAINNPDKFKTISSDFE